MRTGAASSSTHRRLTTLLRLGCFAGALIACTADRPCSGPGCAQKAAAAAPASSSAVEPTLVDPEAACAMQSARAERGPSKQVDIIFAIDNSGSMSEEIAAIRENINRNFAALVQDSGVDFRVILLSLHGTGGTTICIEPPLAGAPCTEGLYATNSDSFFHYNVEVASLDAFCLLLYTFDHPDPEERAPRGWQEWLRPSAEKVFVLFTDDSAACLYRAGPDRVEFGRADADPYADALLFHETLLALSPEQFGTPANARYRFFSIVGLGAQDPPTEPWFPGQSLNPATCESAPSAGLAYQALSVITDALRYPVCEGKGFDAVFRVLARNVIEASKLACVFELPAAPEDQAIDPRSIRIQYANADGEPPRLLEQIADETTCSARSFYIRDGRIELCPEACLTVQADPSTEIDVLYGCNVVPK
jgi:hypothetical protein